MNFFYLEAELLYNSDMAKNIKLTCNLTGDSRYVSEEAYEKLTKTYGSEQKLEKYYIKKEISLLIKRGTRIFDISTLHSFEYDKEKEDYYKELVQFHGKQQPVKLKRKQSRTNFVETDKEVSAFIEAWKLNNNNNG